MYMYAAHIINLNTLSPMPAHISPSKSYTAAILRDGPHPQSIGFVSSPQPMHILIVKTFRYELTCVEWSRGISRRMRYKEC